MRLKNKVALVTGGGSGVGKTAALTFAREGADVIIVDWDSAAGQRTVAEIESLGRRSMCVKADISNRKQVEEAIQKVKETFDHVDILFNNAGIGLDFPYRKNVIDASEEDWDKVVSVNLKGVYLMSKYTLPIMAKGGSVVNTASSLGLIAMPNTAAYCASKGGVLALTRAMALDHAPQGIRVNAICPGAIDTPMLDAYFKHSGKGETLRELTIQNHPLRRIATPQDIANVALFLASDEASFVTGAAYVIDGGYTAK